MKIKILIDSSSDINLEEAKKLGVELMPIEVRFGNEQFLDGVNITTEMFYDKLTTCSDFPKTSQINSFAYEEKYKELTSQGYDVVVITLSSKLSGIYNNAVAAAKDYEGKVFVVDSCHATASMRLLCEYALKLVKDGYSASDIKNKLDEVKSKVTIYAFLDTLTYLRKGGRISTVAAVVGSILSIKPIITYANGEIKLAGKAMGAKKGINILTSLVQKKEIDFDLPCFAIYSGTDDGMIKKYVKENEELFNGNVDKIRYYTIGSAIGAHIGPGAIGLVYFTK